MAFLTPNPGGYSPNVYQIETTDPAVGGPGGIANLQAKQLIANDIAINALAENTKLKSLSDVRLLSSASGPLTYNSDYNGNVFFFTGPNNNLVLTDITGDTDYPTGAVGHRVAWTRIVCADLSGGLAMHKPVGMAVYYMGPFLSSGDAADPDSEAVIFASERTVVDIYLNNNLAIIVSKMVSNSPGFKPGMMVKWGTEAAVLESAWWLNCAGQAVSRTTYAELFAVIGTTYGAGDGTTTFNVPNDAGFMIRHRA